MSDPIADLLTRLRNASMARHRYFEVPMSRAKKSIVEILKAEGYIEGFLCKEDEKQGMIRVYIKYTPARRPVVQGLKRMSRPGCRRYVGHNQVPVVFGGMGTAILSTSQGVMSGREAREKKVGGELLCYVW